MPKLTQILRPKRSDHSQGKNESDPDYLKRMAREPASDDNFSAYVFRFCHTLNLDLKAANLALIIAGTVDDYAAPPRCSELELSAAAVYQASWVRDKCKSSAQVAKVSGVPEQRIQKLEREMYAEQERLGSVQWRGVFGKVGDLTREEWRSRMTRGL